MFEILFKNGTKRLISEEDDKMILEESIKPGAEWFNFKDGFCFRFADVEKIAEILESDVQKKERNTRRLRGMMKGLKQYIDGPQYQGTEEPKLLLKEMEKKLEAVLAGREYRCPSRLERFLV